MIITAHNVSIVSSMEGHQSRTPLPDSLLAAQHVALDPSVYRSLPVPDSRLTKPYRGNSAKETAERIPADSNSLVVRSLRGGRAVRRVCHVDFWKVLEERWKRQEATQYTLPLLTVSRFDSYRPSSPDRSQTTQSRYQR